MEYWKLDDDNQPARCDLDEWCKILSDYERRRVARTYLGDGQVVSTIFIGIDHRFWGKGPPLLFETMLFDAEGNGTICHRASSWSDAEAIHLSTVKAIKKENADA